MADAPEIKVKLTAEDTGVSAAIKELTSQLKTLKTQQADTATSGASLASAFRGIASAAALIGLAKIGKDAFDSAVNIGKMADKTGITTQTLSVFHHVAEELGVSTEAVDKSLVKAAKSITQFQQGSVAAAAGFKLLGITQKEFAGLKPDEALKLITARLGGMTAGFNKTTAAQLIFSKGGAEMIPVLNAIAGEGFDNVSASVAKLGLLLDQTTTDNFRAAKASMQELSDVGAGMATQFEAGLLPAISDVADALLDSTIKGGDGFKEMGQIVGSVIKDLAFAFFAFGDSVGAIVQDTVVGFETAWEEIKSGGMAVFGALARAAHGDMAGAWQSLKEGIRDVGREDTDFAVKHKAIWDQTAIDINRKREDLFKSDEDEAQAGRKRVKNLRPDKQEAGPAVTKDTKSTDAAGRAQLAFLAKQMEDELALLRAHAKQDAQIDKGQFDQGVISLKTYYDRRRAEITADAAKETAILKQGVANAQAEAAKATKAKGSAATEKDADKQEALRIQALTKVEELQTKISEQAIEAATKTRALDDEEFKAREANQKSILDFQKLTATAQGEDLAAAKAEIEVEKQRMQIVMEQAGMAQSDINARLAAYEKLKLAEVRFTETAKDGAAEIKVLDDQKAAIEDQVKNGKLFQAQADQQILDLYRQQLPALELIAAKMKENATSEEQIAKADSFQGQLDKIKSATNTAGQQMATLRSSVQGGLTQGLTQSFNVLLNGTRNVGQAFRQMAGSILASIAQTIAQMYIQIMVTKLLKAASKAGGFSGGGNVGAGSTSASSGHAEGGLIKGAGGPKSDSIPARVSPGEYIVKADAVSSFGVKNLEAINRGLTVPSIANLTLPKFAEGGLVGNAGTGGGDSNIHLGIGLDEGLILKHLSSKAAANIILQHITNNPKAANKALSRGM